MPCRTAEGVLAADAPSSPDVTTLWERSRPRRVCLRSTIASSYEWSVGNPRAAASSNLIRHDTFCNTGTAARTHW